MPPDERDPAYLWDMLQAAKEVSVFTAGKTLNDVRQDRVLALALERGLELVGEAARRVSEATQARYPQVPWREIIGQRNILAHRYGEIDHAILLATVVRDLPSLIAELERVLGGADGA